jgi:hypothetical protein
MACVTLSTKYLSPLPLYTYGEKGHSTGIGLLKKKVIYHLISKEINAEKKWTVL